MSITMLNIEIHIEGKEVRHHAEDWIQCGKVH